MKKRFKKVRSTISKTTKKVARSKFTKNAIRSFAVITLATIPATNSVSANDIQPVPLSNSTLEGGKEAINAVLSGARKKPALGVAAAITCLACAPAAAVPASASMCVACGILLAKVLG